MLWLRRVFARREDPAPVRRKRYGFIPSDPTSPEAIEPEAYPADAIASEHAATEANEAIEQCRFRT